MDNLRDEHALLQLVRLFQIERDNLAGTGFAGLNAEEAAHDHRTDDQHHQDPCDACDADTESKEVELDGDTKGMQNVRVKTTELDQ